MRVEAELRRGRWDLGRAREMARSVEGSVGGVRELVKVLFGVDVELRKRAADVARRLTERDPAPLARYADELAGLLAELPVEESRTRWHVGLVVPRVARTREQRLRAAGLMGLLEQDESNVVRCSAVEGMGELAVAEESLRDEAEEMVERFLRGATLAMRSRAKAVRKMLAKRYGTRE
jgi:hypothetical protein